MKLEVDTSSPTVAKVSINVPSDEFRKAVDRGLTQVSRNVRMKGFRPGKVPTKLLDKQFGEGVRQEVKERYVQQAYGQAVEEHKLKPIAHPRLSPEALALAEDGSFNVEFEVPLKPEFELPEYKGLAIESEFEPVMDEQIDTTLDEIRRGQSTPAPVGEEGLEEKGFVVAKIWFLHGEEQVFEREGIRLNTVSPPPGVDGETFKAGLLGAKDGDVLEFPMDLPEFIEKEELRGQKGVCKLEITNAMKLVPPTDEELLGLFGDEVADMDGLRAFLRTKLEENAQERENHRIESVLLDRVLDATEVELPAPMIVQQTEMRLNQLAQELAKQGADEERVAAAKEEGRAGAEADARKGLKALLLVEKLGEKEGLLVSQADVDTELQLIAARNQTTIEEVHKYYSENNLGQQLAIEILEKKVRRFLRENADVKEPA